MPVSAVRAANSRESDVLTPQSQIAELPEDATCPQLDTIESKPAPRKTRTDMSTKICATKVSNELY